MLKKIAVASIIIVGFLFLIVILNPVFRIQNKLVSVFNKISIKEAIQLAKDCQIKTTGEPHGGGVFIHLINGSTKVLDSKYTVTRLLRISDDSDHKQFFELLQTSRARCGFEVQSWLE